MELPMKIAVISGSAFMFIIIFEWLAFPAIMKFKIKDYITLEPGKELRNKWSNLSVPRDFKIFMFNVTNAKDVENGGTPILDEIGPFVFDEWNTKVNVVDNETDDTVSFKSKTRWYFNQQRSGNLTGDELVTIPHPVIMFMLLRTAQENPSMLPVTYKAVNGIFDNPTSMFLTVRVKDILFDGIYINCNRSGLVPHATCFEMKHKKSFKELPNDGLLYSILGFKNDSLGGTMKVKRGSKNPLDLNKVVEYKNKTTMDIWPTKECNVIKGTESSVYHTFLEDQETLYGYVSLICRDIPFKFVKYENFFGFDTALYTTSFGDQSKNENEKCYCPTKYYCMKKGAMDLLRCTGAPIVVTFPHFFDADESYLESVRGLHPDDKLHQSKFHFEPFTGVILGAASRFQISFQLRKLENITIMQNVAESMLPILWVEEAVVLHSTDLNYLDRKVFLIFRINKGVMWTVLILSTLGMLCSICMFMRRKREVSIGTTIPKLENDEVSDSNKSSTVINS